MKVGASALAVLAAVSVPLAASACAGGDPAGERTTEGPGITYPAMTTEAEYLQAMEDLSNWGRWGADDELGAANFVTPAKRVAAARLVTEGISLSMAHDVAQDTALDASSILTREVLRVGPGGAADRYQYTGSYHGVIHSHLDAVDCHIMVGGRGYNGVSAEEIQAAGGCPRGSINALEDGIVTRGFTTAPLRIEGGMGSPLNPIATF